ncbi:hypothetical protein BSK56_33370 [Paenibacillus borealis]|uniref:Uncharacterized protein n=1 Tax=Paenibacillus borealis TaxID=160799 RepID=A0ABX3GRK2_PAEBO|nr:hypothetical protein BSK56_33370 [Paenibacillus borealis]
MHEAFERIQILWQAEGMSLEFAVAELGYRIFNISEPSEQGRADVGTRPGYFGIRQAHFTGDGKGAFRILCCSQSGREVVGNIHLIKLVLRLAV